MIRVNMGPFYEDPRSIPEVLEKAYSLNANFIGYGSVNHEVTLRMATFNSERWLAMEEPPEFKLFIRKVLDKWYVFRVPCREIKLKELKAKS